MRILVTLLAGMVLTAPALAQSEPGSEAQASEETSVASAASVEAVAVLSEAGVQASAGAVTLPVLSTATAASTAGDLSWDATVSSLDAVDASLMAAEGAFSLTDEVIVGMPAPQMVPDLTAPTPNDDTEETDTP